MQLSLYKIIAWFVPLMILLLLAGCHGRQHQMSTKQDILPYKVTGANDATMMAMQERFNKQGVRVITEGQDYLVSIPSSVLFPNESPQLTWGSYALLNDVACYIKQFRKVGLMVTAFSSKCVSAKRERALTLARARAVGGYLSQRGIDSRFIFTQGLGSDKPIVSMTKGGDNSPNSRIEITFRDAVA